MWIDTHCHVNLPDFDADLDETIQRAREAGVEGAVVVGIDLPTSRRALEMAADHPYFTSSVGVHPHDAAGLDEKAKASLEGLAASASAIGETGLDYYRERSPRSSQKEAFRWHVDLALQLGRPVVIHCRDAQDDVLAVLRGFGRPLQGVMHCFSGDAPYARACLDLGLHISIAGPVTYPKADGLRSVVREIPEDRLLIETDCPFLPPQPVRGKRNEPAYVRFTGEKVAHLRGVEPERLGEITTRNARALFGLTEGGENV